MKKVTEIPATIFPKVRDTKAKLIPKINILNQIKEKFDVETQTMDDAEQLCENYFFMESVVNIS